MAYSDQDARRDRFVVSNVNISQDYDNHTRSFLILSGIGSENMDTRAQSRRITFARAVRNGLDGLSPTKKRPTIDLYPYLNTTGALPDKWNVQALLKYNQYVNRTFLLILKPPTPYVAANTSLLE